MNNNLRGNLTGTTKSFKSYSGLPTSKLSHRSITGSKSKYVTKPELLKAINMNQGTHRIDGSFGGPGIKTTTNLFSMIIGDGIDQGVDMGERTSDTITLTGFRGIYRVENTSTTDELKFRLFIVEPVRPIEDLAHGLFDCTTAAAGPCNFETSWTPARMDQPELPSRS